MDLEKRSSKRRALLKMLKKIFLKYLKKLCQELKKTNLKRILMSILLKNRRKKKDRIRSRMSFLSMIIKIL
jgi:hypothetical protein